MTVKVVYEGPIPAPIAAGTPLARLGDRARPDMQTRSRLPLLAGKDVGDLSPLSRLGAAIKLPGSRASARPIRDPGPLHHASRAARGPANRPRSRGSRRAGSPSAASRPSRPASPAASPGAEAIRDLLVHGATDRWDAVTEALLHFAARRDHLRVTILPALDRGAWVVSDRFADSTMAYQGIVQGVGLETVRSLYELTVGALVPDLTLVLDLPVEIGLRRAGERGGGDRYERMGETFHGRLRQAFLEIARQEPERCVVIDADRPVDDVAVAIRDVVAEHLL